MKQKESLTMFKKLTIFMLFNFALLELFTCGITIYSFCIASRLGTLPDLTPLNTLIGAVIGETLSFAIYAAKSAKENSEKGITYLAAQHKMELEKQQLNFSPPEDSDNGD